MPAAAFTKSLRSAVPVLMAAASAAFQPAVLAQDAAQVRQVREALYLDTSVFPVTYYPYLGAGVPSGFGASWGDVSAGVSYAGRDNVRREADGALSLTAGFGDPVELLALELTLNVLSMRNFGSNLNYDLKLHRMLYRSESSYVSASIGRNNVACKGRDACNSTVGPNGLAADTPSDYGALSLLKRIRSPFSEATLPLKTTVGLGNGYFNNRLGNTSPDGRKWFGDVGVQVHPQIGLSMGLSGIGYNAGASIVPVRRYPIIVNLLGVDLSNRTAAGRNHVFSVHWVHDFTD